MHPFSYVLCGLFVGVIVAGCDFSPVSVSPPSPPPTVTEEPAEPERYTPADTAGEPDSNLVDVGRQLLIENNYTPMPTFSERGKLGIVRIYKDVTVKLDDAVVVFEDKNITDSRMKLDNGEVFFNVDKTGPLKVGEFELKKGECVLFENGQFKKLDLVVEVK